MAVFYFLYDKSEEKFNYNLDLKSTYEILPIVSRKVIVL